MNKQGIITPLSSRYSVLELRCYDVVPMHFGAFLQACKQHYHLRKRHSPMLGYWTTEVGGVNQTVHLWGFESLAHRAKVRKAVSLDEVWAQTYIAPTRHMLQQQRNYLLTPCAEAEYALGAHPPSGLRSSRTNQAFTVYATCHVTDGQTEPCGELLADISKRLDAGWASNHHDVEICGVYNVAIGGADFAPSTKMLMLRAVGENALTTGINCVSEACSASRCGRRRGGGPDKILLPIMEQWWTDFGGLLD